MPPNLRMYRVILLRWETVILSLSVPTTRAECFTDRIWEVGLCPLIPLINLWFSARMLQLCACMRQTSLCWRKLPASATARCLQPCCTQQPDAVPFMDFFFFSKWNAKTHGLVFCFTRKDKKEKNKQTPNIMIVLNCVSYPPPFYWILASYAIKKSWMFEYLQCRFIWICSKHHVIMAKISLFCTPWENAASELNLTSPLVLIFLLTLCTRRDI